MTFPAPCAACAMGNHAEHDGTHHGPKGCIGGTQCTCPGDCTPLDLSSLFRSDKS